MKRALLVAAFVLAAALTLFATAPAALAANTTCAGILGSNTYPATVTNINGNVVVPNGASCALYFVNVSGNVQVGRGSTLIVNGYNEPSTIAGNVEANQCASTLIEGAVLVGGNLQIQLCTGSGPNGFQGPDVVIKGNFLCQGNSSNAAPCLAWLGKVFGNVEIAHNMSVAPSDVSLVDISGNLNCEANALAPTHVHGPDWVAGQTPPPDQCAGFATTTTSISNGAVQPATSCAALAALPASGFPVPNTVIVSAVDTAGNGSLPDRCIVNGYVNRHLSPVDNCFYQNGFQVQLPSPANWNGRFFGQGGGGTEGAVPLATGTDSGSAGSNFRIINGYAVASQDGGHENSDLAVSKCDSGYGNANEFYLDPLGTIMNSYQSIEVTQLTAKYLINRYYGTGPNRSYWVGCSTGGRQGMVMSQNFPQFFDGIVAGDPVYDLQAIDLSETNGVETILEAYNADPSLPPLTFVPQHPPMAAEPILYPAFTVADQTLFETALLQACDALDGVTDGVVDNLPACWAKFDPTNASYVDYAGTLGPPNTAYRLQCTGAKNATCLSPAQIEAAIRINLGPRSNGAPVLAPAGAAAPDHVDNTAQGYAYDGGWMTTVGIPARKIGTPTTVPGDAALGLGAIGYRSFTIPQPSFYALSFNFNADLGLLTDSTPEVTASTSLDISEYVKYGHKIIWYHGLSDPGPPVLGTLAYYNQMAQQFGGLRAAQNFSRFYPVPNMDHCTGGATTDQFDMLTPLVNWVEHGVAPGPIPATGVNFNATTYQVLGNYITGGFINAPTTRSRPLCPYPQEARFTGSTTLVNGVAVATNPADLASAANYTCIEPQSDHAQGH